MARGGRPRRTARLASACCQGSEGGIATRPLSSTHRSQIIIVAALIACCFAAPSVAAASPALDALHLQAGQVELQLRDLQSQLTSASAQFQQADDELEASRQALAEATTQLAQLDTDIETAQGRLNTRAVDLYKSGGLDYIDVLLGIRSLGDLITRVDLIAMVQESDRRMVTDLNTSREEQAKLQIDQARRESELVSLRAQADVKRSYMQSLVDQEQRFKDSLSTQILAQIKVDDQAALDQAALDAGWLGGGGGGTRGTFSPADVISDANFRAAASMSQAQVQSFLDQQPGVLKTYIAADHDGGTAKPAAQLIWEACQQWQISPKVMLCNLEKEQGLLNSSSPKQKALDWAIGMGVPDGGGHNMKYQGFGNQIWYGTRALSRYVTTYGWYPGRSMTVRAPSGREISLTPANGATFSLYTYTPWVGSATGVGGNYSFWAIYWKHFGDPGQ